jgi:hypothetical protein
MNSLEDAVRKSGFTKGLTGESTSAGGGYFLFLAEKGNRLVPTITCQPGIKLLF